MAHGLAWAVACALLAGCVAVDRADVGAFQPLDGGAARLDAAADGAAGDSALADRGPLDAAPADGGPGDLGLPHDGAVDADAPDAQVADASPPDGGELCEPGTVVACGTAEGRCQNGLRTCGVDRVLGPCEDAIGPRDEICDAVDDDCDGLVDEAAPCAVPGGQAACEAGACVFQGCAPGLHDADGDLANGCELALALELGEDLGPATAGPWAAGDGDGLAVAWADADGQLQLDGLGARRTVPFDVGRCLDVTVVVGPDGAFAACQTHTNQCPVIRSASEAFLLTPCAGPPGLTAAPPGVLVVAGDELRWMPLAPEDPEQRELQARLGTSWLARVAPAGFGLADSPHAVAYERRDREAQVVGREGGSRLAAIGTRLAGSWRQISVHWLGDGAELAVLTLVDGDRLVRVRTSLPALVADAAVDVEGGPLPDGVALGRLSSFEGDDGRLWIMTHAAGVPDGAIRAFVYDPAGAAVETLSLRFPALEGADLVAFVRGPAGPEVVFRREGRARRARLSAAP